MSDVNNPEIPAGHFGWNELMTSDVESAKKFYGEIFGWVGETEIMPNDMEYTIFKKGETMVAGMLGISDDMGPVPPHWMSYVMTVNIEEDVAKAQAAGATILKEVMEIPDVGKLAIVEDPQGAVFSLWQSLCSDNS